ncbi:TPA: hypothetical protein R0J97_005508 [Klebsiella quasipneumoniae]|uniref:hypothetical protein n=1 Tax=Klebsiella pneumoniae TaxID=573 RepID=UPI0010914A8F|nr:hypothetical protein [Klebsiella pneumoniae]EKS1982107.1 hypothetical protein [Klebsiella variicola]HCA9668000.1 hypothetical protein [Klebsiella variicola subsp. variicola]HEB4963964.1 hypothetical protein [Klebsiella quasipneumoniae]ELW9495271.1 hypothetical protein [Klebsiella variicola]MCE7513884.1 hypothetical protein [Klebsiella pneumoniae]
MDTISEKKEIFAILDKYDLLSPPYESGSNLIADFEKRIDSYINAIDTIATIHPNNLIIKDVRKRKLTITSFSEKIVETLTLFLQGNIREAYSTFDYALTRTKMNNHVFNMTRPLSKICNSESPLFRVRRSDNVLKERKELFHIPFENRHLVGAMRFSVSGLPCLYLGSSIFVCWQEMGKPDFDKLYISSFKTDEQSPDLMILDLGYSLTSAVRTTPMDYFFLSEEEDLEFEEEDGENENNSEIPLLNKIVSKLVAWPLVLACNYSKTYINANFHKEYIIPNLLMQWISSNRNKNISGISYRSTKILNQKNKGIGLNIIIPPKMEKIPPDFVGHCPILKETFTMTNPVSWTVFSTLEIQPNGFKGSRSNMPSPSLHSKIENFDESLVELYEGSTFKKVELLVDQMMDYKRMN